LNQGMPTRVSVNLSVSHVRQGRLVLLVRQVLQQTSLPAHLLELELTESQLLENAESVIATFKQLREIGVFLAIDDFGTGYSSLSYLKRFPANSVKIDQSFIRDVAGNEEDAAITRAIITMAHGLNLLVTAEGVETQAQMNFLKANQCDEIQGYLISRPVPAAQFTEFLIAHHAQHID
ncbi:MAG: EAL domain-containing protein, partial [Shewanella sp.]|nr:EAL domain-containing protein [Shewanella sp.]